MRAMITACRSSLDDWFKFQSLFLHDTFLWWDEHIQVYYTNVQVKVTEIKKKLFIYVLSEQNVFNR